MRVTSAKFYKEYAGTVQDLKSKYNRSLMQVSSGKRYEKAADSPLDYYAGKKIDNLYNDAQTKETMIKDVNNRLQQQEAASRSIHTEMGNINTKLVTLLNAPQEGLKSTIDTYSSELRMRQQNMANDMNMQYENFYVLGGNDATTIPFDMSADGQTLTYHHKFAGDSEATNIRMEYQYNTHKDATTGEVISEGGYTYTLIDKEGNPISGKTEDDAMNELLRAMREQGRMSLGYGNVVNRETLPDTYTGGMNMVTGLSSDALRAMGDTEAKSQIRKNMDTSCFGLNARVIKGVENYSSTFIDSDTGVQADRDLMNADLNYALGEMDDSMVRVSDTFRRIGITTTVLEHVESNLQTQQDSYQQEYTDHMGIPLEEAITKMYSDQFAYNAAMQVGSKIMQNSLFDFVR